jgi:hypothetical protein
MAHYSFKVLPRKDGVDFQGSWKVTRSDGKETPATTKQAAINKAYNMGDKGDTLQIHRTDGTIQETRTMQGSGETSDERSMFAPPGTGTFETSISDAFK